MEKSMQCFITNRPSSAWDAEAVLQRNLLHWDTETGVFGIKDKTFHEDKVRYKTITGALSHVSLLNLAWNGLSCPVFGQYWQGEPMSYRIQSIKN
jgi:hypothetical protein